MSFLETLRRVDEGWRSPLLEQFGRYIAPGSPAGLESQAQMAAAVTRQHFGRTMRLFAPLYLSNECINNCSYCGFSRDNPILRVTLSLDQVPREARHLAAEGFRSILLVAGEHPKFVSSGYLEQCLERLRPFIPSLAIEVGPSEAPEYRRMVDAGAEGLVVYQETYHQEEYARLHTAGPKRDFAARLDCPERGYAGGFRRIGLGCLLGLADWRFDVLRLAAHLEHLLRHCWRANFTVSFPRLRPAAGSYEPSYHVTDEDYVRILTAFRLTFPQVGIVLSTREAPALRNALLPLGITAMSAGSHTEPGGYTGAGTDDLHLTVKGRRVDLDEKPCSGATGQFDIADDRSPAEISRLLQDRGFDPVWKDWDAAILDSSRGADKGIAPSVL
ncbi:MAG: 2-iminoacetate synthase ThiH [Verrucomicrobiales bacterium]|nr:2-iminoacetate synthase ThiH [Verrucomicrobiales bacterium]